MKRYFTAAAASFVFLTGTAPSPAQPRPGASELPIKQIVLFSSGVAYYQREGQIDGNSRVDMQFHMDNINDLLKSMILEDRGGGQIATVTYDNRNPIDQTLKSFAVDLTRNPSIGDLLNQIRGEKVEVLTTVDPRAAVGQTETVTGLVVGVEKQRQPLGKDQFIEVAQLNLLTKDGLRGVPLPQVQKVRFLKDGLDQEFRKALEVLATGHDKQKKAVSLNFTGEGKRSVKVGYVTESPIWKTSYRLSLRHLEKEKKDELLLQGWAIVENTADEDWNSVQMGLVSGRPISFQMDLYQPLFITRPTVQLELFASLKPQVYEGDLMDRKGEGKGQGAFGGMPAKPMAAPMQDGAYRLRAANQSRQMLKQMESQNAIAFHKDVATAAVSGDLGEYFQYLIKQPVSLPRQKSALLPIVNEEVTGSKVSIYNENVHKKFPLMGLRFTNSTPLHLCQGPITVFENSTYAGDARIGDLQPKETRLLSYAIDLGTEVDPQQKDTEDLLTVKVFKGIIHQEFLRKETKTFRIKNRSEHARTLLIEHPVRQGFNLIQPKKAAEQARNVYRFEVACESNKPLEYVVEEHLPRRTQISLSSTSDDAVRFLIRTNAASTKVKSELAKAIELREKVSVINQTIAREQRLLTTIEQDQARMRENMKALPQSSEIYQRYVKKYGEQETKVEKLRDQIAKLHDQLDENRRTFDAFVNNLTAE